MSIIKLGSQKTYRCDRCMARAGERAYVDAGWVERKGGIHVCFRCLHAMQKNK